MLHWAWLDCADSCYEPVGCRALSNEHRSASLWLGHTTATAQKKPVPKPVPKAGPMDAQDAARTLLPPCVPVIELPEHAAVLANFVAYNHSLLSKRKRCEDMQTADGAAGTADGAAGTAGCNRP